MSHARMMAALLAGCLATTASLEAQARTCRIVYPERPRNAPKVAYLFDGKVNHEVQLPSMNLSPVIELPAGNIFVAMTAEPVVDINTLPTNVPVLRISEATGDFYILVTPDADNPHLPVKLNLVDAGQAKLKPGETLWFNMTPHRVVAVLGEAKLSVDPLKRAISTAPLEESGYYVAQLSYQENAQGPFLPITEQQWWHDANSRHLGFVVSTGGKLPAIYYFRDFRLPQHIIEANKGAEEGEVEPEQISDPIANQ